MKLKKKFDKNAPDAYNAGAAACLLVLATVGKQIGEQHDLRGSLSTSQQEAMHALFM
jgi:hypothetical protein